MQTIIELNGVSFRYSDEAAYVLDNVTLSIGKGEFVALIGANGSGKTTLAKHMNAILVPNEGTVSVNGMDTADEAKLYDIRSTVGMVFQNPDNQIVASVVEEDVAFALENLGVPREEIRRRIDLAMETAGVMKYKNASPNKLSGGQKQRVAIAGVLAMEPACIVMDEPTAMLDPVGRAKVIRTIQKLNKEQGITIVLITHFMEDAALADRIAVMHKGKLVRQGAPRDIFADIEGMRALELDVPPTTALCAALRNAGVDIARDIVSPAACVDRLAQLLEAAR